MPNLTVGVAAVDEEVAATTATSMKDRHGHATVASRVALSTLCMGVLRIEVSVIREEALSSRHEILFRNLRKEESHRIYPSPSSKEKRRGSVFWSSAGGNFLASIGMW